MFKDTVENRQQLVLLVVLSGMIAAVNILIAIFVGWQAALGFLVGAASTSAVLTVTWFLLHIGFKWADKATNRN